MLLIFISSYFRSFSWDLSRITLHKGAPETTDGCVHSSRSVIFVYSIFLNTKLPMFLEKTSAVPCCNGNHTHMIVALKTNPNFLNMAFPPIKTTEIFLWLFFGMDLRSHERSLKILTFVCGSSPLQLRFLLVDDYDQFYILAV